MIDWITSIVSIIAFYLCICMSPLTKSMGKIQTSDHLWACKPLHCCLWLRPWFSLCFHHPCIFVQFTYSTTFTLLNMSSIFTFYVKQERKLMFYQLKMGSMKSAFSTLLNLRYWSYVIPLEKRSVDLITYLRGYRYVLRYVMSFILTKPNPKVRFKVYRPLS